MITGENEKPELIIGLVGPAGVRLSGVTEAVSNYLKSFGYTAERIHVSKLLEHYHGYDKSKIGDGEGGRILYCQDVALDFRRELRDGAAPALAAIAEIRRSRAAAPSGSPDRPKTSHAYILDQLKHPREVELLRQVYGSAFVLLAGHEPKTKRGESLARRCAPDPTKSKNSHYVGLALKIIEDDENQSVDPDFGQNTRDTYPLADFFIDLTNEGGEKAVERFVRLLFGHPFETPYQREYAMHQAWSASLRSSDYNRQVGAVIVKHEYEPSSPTLRDLSIVATGMNEVPRAGGGLYWRDVSGDPRDQALEEKGDDRAKDIKTSVLTELLDRIKSAGLLKESGKQSDDIVDDLLKTLKGTQFMNIGEFSRPVHAEMAALIDSARRGVAVQDLSMYVTTFPCHNCAKHIIAAGLKQVVYLEPYPKSRAQFLHNEEIVSEAPEGATYRDKVAFIAYTGVAPRQFQRLFSMDARGKKHGISKNEWEEKKSSLLPLYIMENVSASYLLNERQELERLPEAVYKWDKKKLCPD